MQQIFSLKLSGDLNQMTIVEYSTHINGLIESITAPSILILDFSEVHYMNSTAIGYLADWYNIMEEKESEIKIIGAVETIVDTLTLVGLSNRIGMHSTMDAFKEEYKKNIPSA